MSDGNHNNEGPLDETETWVMRVGFVVIVVAIALGVIQQYGGQD